MATIFSNGINESNGEAIIAWYTHNTIKLIKAGIAYLSKIVKYDIVGKRVVTANLKLIDDNIKVNVEPILVLDDITEKENGIKPSDVIKTRLKIHIIIDL